MEDAIKKMFNKDRGYYICFGGSTPVLWDKKPQNGAEGPFETFAEAKEAMLADIEGQILQLKEKYSKLTQLKE